MIYLKSLTYSTFQWTLNKVCLNRQSLVVGPNATGKTKMLESIFTVINTLLMQDNNWKGNTSFKAWLEFDGDYSLTYDIDVNEGKIIYENLKTEDSDKTLLKRSGEGCTFYDEENITLPERSTALAAKLDVLKYPEVANIMRWVQTTRFITFSLLHIDKLKQMHQGSISMEEMYESLDKNELRQIREYMNTLNYHLEDIQKLTISDDIKFVTVKEKGVKAILPAAFLSNGMYRVLYILFYMFYISRQNVKCILVDDLGEGLDYDRATNLGKIVFDFCDKNDIQLLATSNDSFLMNVIPLDNWVILNRNQETVDAISATTHKDIFDKFAKTGLRNFDILRTDFIERNQKKED